MPGVKSSEVCCERGRGSFSGSVMHKDQGALCNPCSSIQIACIYCTFGFIGIFEYVCMSCKAFHCSVLST